MNTAPKRIELARALGIVGWSRLDPLLLASLSLEAPLLLLGAHGTAKTLLAERVAGALGETFRHYNASLVNYDDLVGIPLPTDNGELRFVGTSGAAWGAGFIFFDEINRCRPDLQNKMFPIIHERRIAGIDLGDLRHRWAAMNPSSGEDNGYLGTEALDAALLDRFPFIVAVPDWGQLNREDRIRLAVGETAEPTSVDLPCLLRAARAETARQTELYGGLAGEYVVLLSDLLSGGSIHLSPRRARMLTQTILATSAAAQVLGRDLDLKAAAELTVLNGLPHWGDTEPPAISLVIAAHNQAWETVSDSADPTRRLLLEEPDEVKRLKKALDLNVDEPTIATLTTRAIASLPTEAERIGLAAVLTRALANRPLTPAAWSTLTELGGRVLAPRVETSMEAPGTRLEAWRNASGLLAREKRAARLKALEESYITGCGPELLAKTKDPEDLLADFRRHVDLFGVKA